MPRFRLTVRGMMAVVAITAVDLFLWLRESRQNAFRAEDSLIFIGYINFLVVGLPFFLWQISPPDRRTARYGATTHPIRLNPSTTVQFPRFRLTLRLMMVLVAIVSIALGIEVMRRGGTSFYVSRRSMLVAKSLHARLRVTQKNCM